MRGRRAVLGFSLILALAPSHPGGAAEEPTGPYVWPLKGYNDISSGFCDYRTRHYHGGIDLSTNGAEGIPVRAADSGWVERVSTGYWGYGKAVYLKLADGRMAVYGHLAEFSPAIQAYVEENQYSSKRYQQNLWPPPHQLPVGRGEVIGKTGQTGAGPPHLHFEIRTGDNKPLNPLTSAFEVADGLPPIIRALVVFPRQPDVPGEPLSHVDGRPRDALIPVDNSGAVPRLGHDPDVVGVCGIAVLTHDAITNGRRRASTYEIRLWVNDLLIADLKHDSISYDDTRQIALSRLYDAKPGYDERPMALYRVPGNSLWHYRTLVNDGWLRIGETAVAGVNDIRIEAVDAGGNTTTLEFRLNMAEPLVVEPEAFAGEPGQPRIPEVQQPAGVLFRLNRLPLGRPPALDSSLESPLAWLPIKNEGNWSPGGDIGVWLPLASFRDTLWIATATGSAPLSLPLQPIMALSGGEVVADDGYAVARFAPGDLYESWAFQLTGHEMPEGVASRGYYLTPSAIPFSHAATFMIRYDKGDHSRVALYRDTGSRRRWEFVGNELFPGPMIGGKIEAPGAFALLADHDPPVIRNVTPGRGESTRNKRPTIRFEMFDILSGIGSDADVTLTIDGAWVPVEYDPDTRQAKARPRAALSKGKHEVEIKVRDRVGNETSFLRIITIVG